MNRHNTTVDEALHAAEVESLERRIIELALARTNSRSGAIFLWDEQAQGLVIDFHVVEGLFINLSSTVLRHRTDRPNGIALWVLDHNQPYLCNDTSRDPNYATYFLDVMSIAAVPIPYQNRAIGVISVSSLERDAYDAGHIDELEALAASSAKFLRRAQLHRAKHQEGGRFLLIKGLCPEWLEVERKLEQSAATDVPILIHGESGTGKELVANAIHFNSQRARKPFITVNCAAIPEQLLESTLFGHVRGAFTGATFTKLGEFQQAESGTLFLDEVGDLPITLQPKVLRAIELGEVHPLGSNKPAARVDVRLVCATNRDLAAMVRQGLFREDLYYRISPVTLRLPPLRAYRHNLPLLARVFVRQAAERHHREVAGISASAMTLLQAHSFPGNIRELKNTIEHAVIMARGEEVQPEDLPANLRPGPTAPPSPPAQEPGLKELRETWLAPLERQYLTKLLTDCAGNVREAARRAGVNTVTMYRLLKKRGLQITRQIRETD